MQGVLCLPAQWWVDGEHRLFPFNWIAPLASSHSNRKFPKSASKSTGARRAPQPAAHDNHRPHAPLYREGEMLR